MLFESPFTELNDQGIEGVFNDSNKLVKVFEIIDRINGNALVA